MLSAVAVEYVNGTPAEGVADPEGSAGAGGVAIGCVALVGADPEPAITLGIAPSASVVQFVGTDAVPQESPERDM